jgi:hypothetical protein
MRTKRKKFGPPQSKKASERIHFKRRLLERYGIKLTTQDIRNLVNSLGEKGRVVKKQSNSRTVHDITINDRLCRVVYDKKRKVFVTALEVN